MSYELVHGIHMPSALNLFELARLVESIIIHDKITVLDTSPYSSAEEKQIALASKAVPGDFMSIKKATPQDIITKYVDKSFPGFSSDLDGGSKFNDRLYRKELYDGVIEKVAKLLLSEDSPEMKIYEALLRELSENSRKHNPTLVNGETNREWRALTEQRVVRPTSGWFMFRSPSGPSRGSPLDVYEDQESVFDAYSHLYRSCDPSGGSGFAQWLGLYGDDYRSFARSMFSRANLYILAGDLLDAPYRPGALRWPICWNHFSMRRTEKPVVAEAFVHLAKSLRLEQATRLEALLGSGFVSHTIPLFLRVVLKECKGPDEILRKAVAIRWSNEATRFRSTTQRLTQRLEDGQFGTVLQELTDCSRALSKKFGLSESNAEWTLLSAPALSMKPHTALDQSASLSANGATIAKLGKSIWSWWKARRYGLIIRSADTVQSTRSLSKEVEAVFKHTIDDQDMELLEKLESSVTSRSDKA